MKVMMMFVFATFVFASLGAIAQDAPLNSTAPVATGATLVPSVQTLDPVFIPPAWLQSTVLTMKSLPIIGPIMVVALQWLGVLLSILTALTACALTVTRALSTVLSLAGLVNFANLVQSFSQSKFMFYLKYVSAFNAQKDEPKA